MEHLSKRELAVKTRREAFVKQAMFCLVKQENVEEDIARFVVENTPGAFFTESKRYAVVQRAKGRVRGWQRRILDYVAEQCDGPTRRYVCGKKWLINGLIRVICEPIRLEFR